MRIHSGETVLIIPAAGAGTRLESATPKVLSPVLGRAMIDYLFALYRSVAGRFVLVVHPSFESAVIDHVRHVAGDLDVACVLQQQPTGMLDAILLASGAAATTPPLRVWITWCDQIAIHPHTIATLARMSDEHPSASVVMPTSRQSRPYIHLERNARGQIAAVSQRREGDVMPEEGESDMGLFSLSPDAFFAALPQFAQEAATAAHTRERNFLPFVPWAVRRGHTVLTFPATNDMEAVGINTPDDRLRIEQYLRENGRS